MKSLDYLFPFLASLVLCLTSCSGYSITGGPGRAVPKPAQREKKLAAELLGIHSVYVAPIRFAPAVKQSEGVAEILSASVKKNMRTNSDFEVLEPENKPEPFKGTDAGAQRQYFDQIAQTLQADGVLFTSVQQYTERVGSKMAAEQSARVAFTFSLQKVGTTQAVWQASYFFEDEALSDNLLRIGERMKEVNKDGRKGWWTARELFDRGARELSTKLASDRRQLFTGRGEK